MPPQTANRKKPSTSHHQLFPPSALRPGASLFDLLFQATPHLMILLDVFVASLVKIGWWPDSFMVCLFDGLSAHVWSFVMHNLRFMLCFVWWVLWCLVVVYLSSSFPKKRFYEQVMALSLPWVALWNSGALSICLRVCLPGVREVHSH